MSYYNEAMKYRNWILHQYVKNGQISEAIANQAATDFAESRDAFEEAVARKARSYNIQPTSEFIKECLQTALVQIMNSIIRNQQHFVDDRSMNIRTQYDAPNYGPMEQCRSIQQDNLGNQIHSLNLSGADAPPTNSQPQETVRSRQPTDPGQSYSKGVIMEMKTNKNYSDMDINQKLAIRISGSTLKKIDGEVFALERALVVIKQTNNVETIVKFDILNILGQNLVFDSSNDIIEFVQGQMSSEDINDPHFRIVSAYVTEAIDCPHDLFFAEMDKLDKYITSEGWTMTPVDDILSQLDICLKIIDAIQKRDSEFSKPFEQFLLKQINDVLATYVRFSSLPKRVIALGELNDLEVFIKDARYADMRKEPAYDGILRKIFKIIFEVSASDHEIHPFKATSDLFPVYVKTRKYMSVLNTHGGLNSLDYWQYDDERKALILDKMKERVLVGVPKINIITNVYSPSFLRNTMMTMEKIPVVIPSDIDKTNMDNIIYSLLGRAVDKRRNIPSNMFYVYNKGEYKTFKLGLTFDGDIIIS